MKKSKGFFAFYGFAFTQVALSTILVAYMELVLSRAGFTAMGSWQFYVLHLLFLLPCALLMTPAGYFSDKFPKERVLRWTTLLSLPAVVLFGYGVCTANLLFEFLSIGLFFVLQAFQSPAKNGYMKELVGVRSLAQGSGILMIILFVALVLSGGVTAYAYQRMLPVAGDLSEALQTFAPVGITLVALEILGILFTFGLPPIGAYDAELKFPWKRYWNLLFTRRKLSKLWVNRALRQSIIGLSMFWVMIFLMVFVIQDLFGSGSLFNRDILANYAIFGTALGLVVGKPLGIFLVSFAAIKAKICVLPSGVNWKILLGGGMLAGIGFTMSLFVAGLAFGDPSHGTFLAGAKVGILTGSFASAILGILFMKVVSKPTNAPEVSGEAVEPV